MPKITKHNGPSNARVPPPTPAEILRARGKLGPYTESAPVVVAEEPETVPEPTEPETPVAIRPPSYAPKADWVAYVKALTGCDDVALDGATKADLSSLSDEELVEAYGQ